MTHDDLVPESPEKITAFRAVGFFPADFAAIESGKVYVGGGFWELLNFPAFPAVVPSIALVAVILVPFHAYQKDHTITMGLVDDEDQPLGFSVEGVFRSAPRIEAAYGDAGTAPVAVPVQGLTFERPGRYSFTLRVDNTEIARYRFRVAQVARVAMAQAVQPGTVE
jgi:hypothetical protein